GDGVEISLAGSGNLVLGNVIGMGTDGVTAVPNGLRGIEIWEGSSGNTIGGTVVGSANLISGNSGDGVRVRGVGTDTNTITGNWIGPDATGTAGPGNNEGVNVFGGAADNVIGPGNVISANRADGVYVGDSGTDGTQVVGSLIGLSTDGGGALANADRGVQVETGATNTVIGGPNAADRNVISGNGSEGIIIADFTASGTTDNQVINNFIGTDQAGATPVPNTRDGVRVVASGGNLIGGVSPFDGNLIAYNGQHGVEISATALADNAITWNRIHSNGGLGIDVGDDGVDLNDPGDADSGPNDGLNHPVIRTAEGAGPSVTVTLDFELQPGDYLFHFHTNAGGADPSGYGEGQSAVRAESLTAHPGGAGTLTATVPASLGDIMTVTTTEDLGASYGSTSEFSAAVTVVAASTDVAPDSSSQRADLAFRGGLSWATSPGKAGLAQEFDGGAARLVGPPSDIDGSGLTISTWVQPKFLSGSPRLVAKSDGAGTPVYELLIDTAGSPQARARIEVGGTVYEAAGGVVTTGWHHLASSWDGSALRVFVDGALVATTPTTGTPTTDPSVPLVLGNTAGATNPLEGRLDEVRVANVARGASWVATSFANQDDPAGFVTAGALQTQAAGAWTATSVETHTGTFALQAPVTDTVDSWITADGITEPGVEFDTWWWFSDTTGDLAQGVRTGAAPVTQHETALVGPTGWDLGRIDPGGRTQDLAPPGGQAPSAGTWTKVTVRIDQADQMTVLIDDTVVIGPVPAAAAPAAGSVGLRGRLPSGQQWYVDDAVARRLVSVEPVASLAALDR
ncbi:MAG: LamG-like jellyroll fold domain-containing protein, partial [Acidimicrobiales bacterium]